MRDAARPIIKAGGADLAISANRARMRPGTCPAAGSAAAQIDAFIAAMSRCPMEKVLYCPKCEVERTFRFSDRTETYTVRDEKVSLAIPTWTCQVCGEHLADKAFGDPVERIYEAYSKRHPIT